MGAGQKWLQLGIDVVSYEFGHSNDGQLLSEGADRLVERFPIAGRVFILAVSAVITLHLANIVDDRWDLMSKRFWGRIREQALAA